MALELDRLLDEIEHDRSIGAVVLTGAHARSFITHYDVSEMARLGERAPDLPHWTFAAAFRAVELLARLPFGQRLLASWWLTAGLLITWRYHRVFIRMNQMDKVFVAAINGTAAAGGAEVALACDVRLMAAGDFMIGVTEPVLGFNAGGGGALRLTRVVGADRGLEMLLEARMLSPRDAEAAGIVHRVVAPEQLLAEAQATASRLARRSPRAVRMCKRIAYEGVSRRWPQALRLDRSGFVWCVVTPAVRQAMKTMLAQIDALPAEQRPSPWHEPDMLHAWQDGKFADFTS
jgi:enoyl-CoA hydratase/carnithine racemase